MDRVWKHLMQLDARALFFGAVALLAVVVILVAWLSLHRPSSTPTPQAKQTATTTNDIGVMRYISNQISAESLVVPVNPFRPSIENMGGGSGSFPTNRVRVRPRTNNLFIGVRPPETAPSIPTFTFRGYFQRPDGTSAALFQNSLDGTRHFFTPGDKLQDYSLLSADIHSAKVQKPDGQTITLAINDSFTITDANP